MNHVTYIDKLIEDYKSQGFKQVTIKELECLVNEVGYTFNRGMDCLSFAKDCTTGSTYPSLTLYPIQRDNKKSAWNYEARRDYNFDRLQAIRNLYFAVVIRGGAKTLVGF